MRKERKRGFISLYTEMAVLLMAFLCTGCGEQQVVNKDVKRESLKSYVQEKDKTELLNMESRYGPQVFVTKSSLYYEYEDPDLEYESVLIQMDHKGKQIAKYPMENRSDFWVRDNYLCYIQKWVDGDDEAIFFVPIEQEKGTEKINWNKKRKIAGTRDLIYDSFAWKSYIYYIIGDTLYQYDIRSNKEKALVKNKFYEAGFQRQGEMRYMQDGKIYINNGCNEPLYSVELDSGKVENIGFDQMDIDDSAVFLAEGNRVFTYICNRDDENEYFSYDTKEKKKIESLDNGTVKRLLQENSLWKETMKFYIEKGFCFDQKLYLVLKLSWQETQKAQQGIKSGQDVAMDKSTQILVSCSWDKISGLTYEKEASEHIQKRQDYVQHYLEGEMRSGELHYEYFIRGSAEFWTLCGGEILISYSKMRDEQNDVDEFGLIGYHLKTGEAREIPKNDLLYQIFVKG